MKKLVRVTQEDIDSGIAGSSYNCPVARAVNRTLGIESEAEVGFSYIRIGKPDMYWSSPKRVRGFVDAFDLGRDVTPFAFFLEV